MTKYPILLTKLGKKTIKEGKGVPKGRPSLCNHFWLYPTRRPTQGFSPHIPASRLFILFHPSKAHHPTQKKEHSLLVLPSVHTIINFATEFFEMFTKKQSEYPQKVFQVFHFAFGPQNSPVLVQIRTNPANRPYHPGAISWLRKIPKKAIHPLVGGGAHPQPVCVATHDPILQAIAVVVFW